MQFLKIFFNIIAALFVLMAVASCTRQPDYSTFEDCILSNVGSSQSSAAILAIREACRAKFPPSAQEIAARRKAKQESKLTSQDAARDAVAGFLDEVEDNEPIE